MVSPDAPSLPPAVDAPIEHIDKRAGPMSYYVAGDGPPVLLVHSINAAASVYEMKTLFEALTPSFRVYAVDLPGFGLSDRSRRPYTVRLYVDAVLDMLDRIREGSDAPVHVVALSLSSEFAARAAVEMPERFRTLTMITPTGFSRGSQALTDAGATREIPGLSAVLTVSLWRKPLYGLLVSRSSVAYFLRRTFGSSDVPEDLIDYAYQTAHQPGAEHAPYAFLSGRLFSKDIRTIYEALSVPVFVAHGTKGDFRDFSEIGWTRERTNWTVHAYDAGAMLHFEQLDSFLEAFNPFVAAAG